MDMNNPSSTSSEVTVFVETSLHTHLAVTARGNDTVSELKTILESEHRYLGRIKIQSLKINRNECWYHLSDSIHVRRVVNGDNQEGFLFADALSLEKDTSEQCNTVVKDASQSLPASKKKRKFEEVTGLEDSLKEKNRSERPSQKKRKFKKVTSLEDSLKENNILICDSGVVASKPEIASELLSISVADSCQKFHSTNSSSRKKDRKKNKSPNPLNEVVDAAPARRGDTEGISIVASTRINVEIPEGEDVAYTGRQGQQENHCTPPQVLQDHHEMPSSLDVDSVTNAGTLERKRGASAEKPDGHPSLGVKAPTQDGTGSAEKALEETKPSQKIEAEPMPTEKHRIPEKGTRDGKDATSELLNTDGSVAPSKKKNKRKKQKKINDVNGDYLVKSGTEHIVGSETDISLAGPHEAVQAEKGSDKAREEDNDLSLKNGEDISEKETEGGTGSAEKALEETELSQKTDSEAMLIEKHNLPDKETEGGTGSAEKPLEVTELSQKTDSEAMLIEKHEVPDKGKRGGNDTTSELLNTDGSVAPSKKKNKRKKQKKTNNVNGDYLVKSGTEHIVGSETDISLAEPHEVVQTEKGSDKAREEDNDLSLKNGEDITEKETEGGTGSAEKALEETELSQKTDSEAMLIEKHNLPDKETEGGTGSAEKALEETELSQKTDSEAMLIEKHNLPDKETNGGTGSAEKALEETELSQKTDSEAMLIEKHEGPDKSKRDGNDATSELLNTDGSVALSKKKNKRKKEKETNDVNGDYLVKSGTEHIVGLETDISLAEPHEAVQTEKGSDKAREEDNDLDISEKETEGGTGSAEKALEETELSQKTDSEAMLIEKHNLPDKETEGGTGSAEKALEETELSQKTDSEAMLIEKHNLPDKETNGGTGSAEKALEETELSQKTDSEAMLIEKHEVPDKGKRDGNDATSELLNTDGSVTPNKKKNKRKKQKKTNDVNGDYLVKSGTEHIVGLETDISLAEPHEAVQAEKGSDKASEEDSNLPLKKEKVVLEKETESSPSVGTDLHKLQGNKSKRKRGVDTTDLHKLQEEKNVSHQDPVLTIDSRTQAQTNRRKKSRLAKTIDQLNVKYPKEDSGVQFDPLCACSNSMSESTEVLSHAKQNTSVGRPLKPDQSGKLPEHFKFDMPDQIQKEVVSSGEVLAEEVARSKESDDNLMPKRNRKNRDLTSHSSHLQSPLKSHDYQRIGEKSEAGNSISVQQGGSISKNDSVLAQPEKMFPKEVAKTGAKAVSSDASGNINSTPKEAGKQSVTNASDANTPVGKRNEGLSNSDMKKSSNQVQSKTGKKHQSGTDHNVVASGKASGIGNGEVLNNPNNRKSSAALVGGDKNGSSKGGDEAVVSGITTSSEYSLSSESDYSDGDSNAGSCASSGKKTSGRIGYSSIKSTPARRLKNDEIFLKSSIYKKAKLAVTLSQMEEDSQAVEFVPDSQPI